MVWLFRIILRRDNQSEHEVIAGLAGADLVSYGRRSHEISGLRGRRKRREREEGAGGVGENKDLVHAASMGPVRPADGDYVTPGVTQWSS